MPVSLSMVLLTSMASRPNRSIFVTISTSSSSSLSSSFINPLRCWIADAPDTVSVTVALEKSKNKEVRTFAEEMVRDHNAVNEQALALVKKLNVTPEDNDTSKALLKQAAEKQASLKELNGAAFDRAYAENEVAYHKAVDGALQNTLIPSASNGELKDLLSTGLKISSKATSNTPSISLAR
jgi:predicted outer membrane protein